MAKKKAADELTADDIQAMLADPEVEGKQALRQKLSAMLGAGALPCPTCGIAPHAMLRRPAVDGNLPIYEVACLAHGGAQRSDAPDQSVMKWNRAIGG